MDRFLRARQAIDSVGENLHQRPESSVESASRARAQRSKSRLPDASTDSAVGSALPKRGRGRGGNRLGNRLHFRLCEALNMSNGSRRPDEPQERAAPIVMAHQHKNALQRAAIATVAQRSKPASQLCVNRIQHPHCLTGHNDVLYKFEHRVGMDAPQPRPFERTLPRVEPVNPHPLSSSVHVCFHPYFNPYERMNRILGHSRTHLRTCTDPKTS